jgi:hypothetical protein
MMTNRQFVMERLNNMSEAPGMWAFTQEGFGLQVILLVEFAELDVGPSDKHALMKLVFGPGNTVSSLPLEDEWARAVVSRVVDHLRI